MLDAFHVVKLGTQVVDQVRRRVQQDIRATAAAGTTRSTGSATSCAPARRPHRPAGTTAGDGLGRHEHIEVEVAWSVAQQVRSAYRHRQPAEGRRSPRSLDVVPSCPIPEVPAWGGPWQLARGSSAYFDTDRASNGGTEAINGRSSPPPHRPRLPQPRQLPAADAAHRRRPHRPSTADPPQVQEPVWVPGAHLLRLGHSENAQARGMDGEGGTAELVRAAQNSHRGIGTPG